MAVHTFVAIFLCIIGFPLLSAHVSEALAQSGDQLPEGKGKETVQKMCGGACHDLDIVTSERLSKQGWTNVVDTMVSRGATGTEAEISLVIDYLAAHFGRQKAQEPAAVSKINVNMETEKELATDLDLSQGEAHAIVQYRKKEGRFKSWDDLAKVPHLDLKKIESKKDRVVF